MANATAVSLPNAAALVGRGVKPHLLETFKLSNELRFEEK
jgi:hypothetical protein